MREEENQDSHRRQLRNPVAMTSWCGVRSSLLRCACVVCGESGCAGAQNAGGETNEGDESFISPTSLPSDMSAPSLNPPMLETVASCSACLLHSTPLRSPLKR